MALSTTIRSTLPPPAPGTIDDLLSESQAAESDRDERAWKRFWMRVARHVPLEPAQAHLAGRPNFPWTQVVEPDRLLEEALSRKDRAPDELDPFWAATWRAARGLDEYISRQPIKGVRVLEIGCGSGQPGIAAAVRGAQVTLSDAVGAALLVARLHSWPIRHRVDIRRLRWDVDTLDVEPFPIILGSDICYDPRLWSMMEACARKHLAPGGKLILSEPQRITGDRFTQWIPERGWQYRTELLDLGDNQRSIRIFVCTLKG